MTGRSTLALCLAALALCAPARAAGPGTALDARAWELVSPPAKNGGEVAPPGAGLLGAAAQGGAVAFASEASFGEAAGAPPLSQYLAARGAGGWATANVTPPLLAGTYSAAAGDADPYLLLSADLSRAVLSGGWACRDPLAGDCEAEAPPLGPGGPPGYRNAYLKDGSTYTPLITAAGFAELPPQPGDLHLDVQGASPDLRHVVLATEFGLYEWSEDAPQLARLSDDPAAALAAPGIGSGAVSEDGERVYFTAAGELRLREGAATETVCGDCAFGAASADGAVAFYLEGGHVHRYLAAGGAEEDLTPGGGATAILGASADGAVAFYLAAGGIFRWRSGAAAKVVSSASPAQLPPATGPAAIAAGGDRLFFTAAAALLPLADSNGRPDAYEWEAQGAGSCTASPGCLGLLSSGRTGEATFAAASASGDDAYFLTAASLLGADSGAVDLYDARAGGGFAEPQPGIECGGDDCQGPPFVPAEAAPASEAVSGPENPKPKQGAKPRHCPQGKRRVVRKGKPRCVPKRRRAAGRGGRR